MINQNRSLIDAEREIDQLRRSNESYQKMLEESREENKRLQEELFEAEDVRKQIDDLKRKLEILEKEERYNYFNFDSLSIIYDYIIKIEELQTEAMSPLTYSRHIRNLPKDSRGYKNLLNIVEIVRKWCDDLDKQLIEDAETKVIDL